MPKDCAVYQLLSIPVSRQSGVICRFCLFVQIRISRIWKNENPDYTPEVTKLNVQQWGLWVLEFFNKTKQCNIVDDRQIRKWGHWLMPECMTEYFGYYFWFLNTCLCYQLMKRVTWPGFIRFSYLFYYSDEPLGSFFNILTHRILELKKLNTQYNSLMIKLKNLNKLSILCCFLK